MNTLKLEVEIVLQLGEAVGAQVGVHLFLPRLSPSLDTRKHALHHIFQKSFAVAHLSSQLSQSLHPRYQSQPPLPTSRHVQLQPLAPRSLLTNLPYLFSSFSNI